MALQLTIYNRQTQTSRSGKQYMATLWPLRQASVERFPMPLNRLLSTSETSAVLIAETPRRIVERRDL